MPMFNARKTSTIVGLDVEAGSIAATEVTVNGSMEVTSTGIAALPPGVTREGEVVDVEILAEAVKNLFSTHKLGKSVRVGVANQRVVVRTLRMPLIEDDDELETAIRFQATDDIPMPIEQSVLDWQVVRRGVGEDQRKMDVVVVAARRDMVSGLLAALRAAGLRPVGIDVSAFGMIRAVRGESGAASQGVSMSYEERQEAAKAGGEDAVAGQGAGALASPATLYCNFGDVTNLAVAQGPSCLFTRVASFGVEGIAQRLSERRGLTLEHSRQWLTHVGLERPLEAIEGDGPTVAATREVLVEGAGKLADELRLSLDFYGHQEGALAIEDIVACGPGTRIQGLGASLQQRLGYPLKVGRPMALGHLDEDVAARLTLSYGLALEQ